MIKKISAIVLALVLCLSVVIVPASAAGVELGDAQIAFALEWDKSSYKAGDMAYLSVYMAAADDVALYTGTMAIGLSSAVFDQTENDKVTLAANTTETNDTVFSYYKSLSANQLLSWYPSTIVSKIQDANTAAENAAFDQYLKVTFSKDTNGSHTNAANRNDGLYGSEIDSTAPIFVIGLKVRDDVADTAVVKAAMTSGSTGITGGGNVFKSYSNPGNASTSANIPAASTSVENSDTSIANGGTDVTIGSAAELAVTYWKDQIKFLTDGTGAYANKFDYRILATIDSFDDVFESADDAMDVTDNHGILEAGFIFSKTGTVDKDTAIAQINGGAATYSAVKGAYVSTSFETGKYVMACYVGNIADSDVDTALSALGYVKYMQDGEEKVATFDAVQTSTFRTLYDKNASNKPA